MTGLALRSCAARPIEGLMSMVIGSIMFPLHTEEYASLFTDRKHFAFLLEPGFGALKLITFWKMLLWTSSMFVNLVLIILKLRLQLSFCMYNAFTNWVRVQFSSRQKLTAAMPPRDIIAALTKVAEVEIPSSYWRSPISTQTGGVVDLSHMQSTMGPRFVNQLV